MIEEKGRNLGLVEAHTAGEKMEDERLEKMADGESPGNFQAGEMDEMAGGLTEDGQGVQEARRHAVPTGNERQEAVAAQSATGNERQEAGAAQSAAGNERQEAVAAQPATGNERQEAVAAQSATGNERQEARRHAVPTGNERQEAVSGGNREQGGQEMADGEERERLSGNMAVVAKRAKVRDGMEKLAAWLDNGDGEQMDLLACGDDLQDKDLLAQAAETVAAPRRQRGRPKGAGNLRNGRVFDYLEAIGHRDPLVTLSMIQTADTRTLASWMGIEVGEALRIQLSAAKEMLPYKYAKRPQELNVNEKRAHLFLTGTLDDMAGSDEETGTLSIFGNKTVSNQ